MLTRVGTALFTLTFLAASPLSAQPADDTSLDEPLPVEDEGNEFDGDDGSAGDEDELGVEFRLDARDRVISASRTEMTIQEAPAIVTVITAEEIEARGFRTVNEILRSVPGFEAPRSDANHWTVEPVTRGNPRTVLVLFNGVNVVEPNRNLTSLDRKIPMAMIERVEIISGPGGVLWGSSAFLGVINIITRTARGHDGFMVRVGGGGGPGDLDAVQATASWGGELLDDVRMFSMLDFFSSRGAEYLTDQQMLIGIFPAPTPDGITIAINRDTPTINERDYFGTFYLNLEAGSFTLNAIVGWERDVREQAYGGNVLTADDRIQETIDELGTFNHATVSHDSIWSFSLQYADRFLDSDFGLSATAYFVSFDQEESPFGLYAPSAVLPTGLAIHVLSEGLQFRTGLNIDADVILPADNHLVFGTEALIEVMPELTQTFPVDPTDPANNETLTDTQIIPTERLVGAAYFRNEWRPSSRVGLNLGARLQVSSTYDPAVLLASAIVVNLFGDTFFKLNYAEGLRPPAFISTHINDEISSGVTFEPNPDLNVERARAIEAEINTVLLENTDAVDQWFLRVDYSFSVLDDLIQNQGGIDRYSNSGTRFIHSVEFLSRTRFAGAHELALSYYYVNVEDDDSGPVRAIANHIINGHARIQIVPELLHFSTDITWIGAREDANRLLPPSDDGLEQILIHPSLVTVDEIDPVLLVRAGVRAENVADMFAFGVFGYNVLNSDYREPDLFFDDRVQWVSFHKPRWSVFGTAEVQF